MASICSMKVSLVNLF